MQGEPGGNRKVKPYKKYQTVALCCCVAEQWALVKSLCNVSFKLRLSLAVSLSLIVSLTVSLPLCVSIKTVLQIWNLLLSDVKFEMQFLLQWSACVDKSGAETLYEFPFFPPFVPLNSLKNTYCMSQTRNFQWCCFSSFLQVQNLSLALQ